MIFAEFAVHTQKIGPGIVVGTRHVAFLGPAARTTHRNRPSVRHHPGAVRSHDAVVVGPVGTHITHAGLFPLRRSPRVDGLCAAYSAEYIVHRSDADIGLPVAKHVVQTAPLRPIHPAVLQFVERNVVDEYRRIFAVVTANAKTGRAEVEGRRIDEHVARSGEQTADVLIL